MKRFTGFLCALFLFTTVFFSAVAAGEVVYVANPSPEDRLNLRKSASAGSDVLGKLYNGTSAQVIQTFGQYTHVRIGEIEGYLQNDFISREPTTWTAGTWLVVNLPRDGEGLNLRKMASKKAYSLGLVFNGTTVARLGEEGDYTKVRMNGDDGYLLTENLSEVGDESLPVATKITLAKLDEATPLYSFPDKESLSLGALQKGAMVTVLESIGTWFYVEASGGAFPDGGTQRGFLPCHLLRLGNYVSGATSQGAFAVVKTGRDSVKLPLRATPSMTGRLVLTLVNTAQVQLIEMPTGSDIWWHVRVGSEEGYMLGEYMEIIESGAPGTW